ncbi:putative thioredoxin [Pisolithus thermaeus]|nr:putative thioredoxin [Pisolithus thermaeus]
MDCIKGINSFESLSDGGRQSFPSKRSVPIVDIAMVETINSYEQFQELINGEEPVVIDFYADWCGPCKAISPIFETLSKKFGTIKFRKVNTDEQEQISQEAGIRALPTFVVFQRGNKVQELVGANPNQLEAVVQGASSLVA